MGFVLQVPGRQGQWVWWRVVHPAREGHLDAAAPGVRRTDIVEEASPPGPSCETHWEEVPEE